MSSQYWLAPLTCQSPLTIGTERIACERATFESFREKVKQVTSPLHLLMFKAELLLGDDEDACGPMNSATLELGTAGDIVFDGQTLFVSHCAQAFFDRLPDNRDWRVTSKRLLESQDYAWNEQELEWLLKIQRWSEQSHDLIVLREEGN